MECLSEETTKQINGKENKNEKMFKLKRVENGIHRQKTTPKNLFVVLRDEVFTRIRAGGWGRTNGENQERGIGGGGDA